jgi:hypothetical protein
MLVWPWNPKTIFIIQEFFKILNCFYLVWPFILLKSRSSKSWKIFLFEIVCKRYQKKHCFALISKKCMKTCPKMFSPKNTLMQNFFSSQKNCFSAKNFFFYAKHNSSAPFWNERKLHFYKYSLRKISKKFFSNTYQGSANFSVG